MRCFLIITSNAHTSRHLRLDFQALSESAQRLMDPYGLVVEYIAVPSKYCPFPRRAHLANHRIPTKLTKIQR